jgi:hypothetical protein
LQPAGYFPDSSSFARNVAKDVVEKARLVTMLQPKLRSANPR